MRWKNSSCQPEEKNWAVNTLLEMLELDGCALPEIPSGEQIDLPAVLDALLDDAYERGVLKENSIVYRDLFDTRLMGALTPRPAQVIEKFNTLYRQSPKEATDWYTTSLARTPTTSAATASPATCSGRR